MTTQPPGTERGPGARDRLLAAAEELFYEEGINTVGIDRVIARAGVAKASLYNTFGSKEELIRAYLTAWHERTKVRVGERIGRARSPRAKLLAVFEDLGENAARRGFRGCPFIRASGESREDAAVAAVRETSRRWRRDLFRTLAAGAGCVDADKLAAQLMLLYDGAAIAAQVDGSAEGAVAARAAAEKLMGARRR